MKQNKMDLILESIILSYLDDNTPIGSAELGSKMGVNIPASTIRVYLKKLSDEGVITQLHISSGRIPTHKTMMNYWQNSLYFSQILSINSLDRLEEIFSRFNIFSIIFTSENDILREVLNFSDRFIVLVFDEGEIVIKFSAKIYKILLNLVGITLNELQIISTQIGLSDLRSKIKELKRSKVEFIANEVVAYEIFRDERFKILFDPSMSMNFSKNLIFEPIFDDGYMGIKREITLKGKNATMLCAGSVYEDFNKLFNHITEAA